VASVQDLLVCSSPAAEGYSRRIVEASRHDNSLRLGRAEGDRCSAASRRILSGVSGASIIAKNGE